MRRLFGLLAAVMSSALIVLALPLLSSAPASAALPAHGVVPGAWQNVPVPTHSVGSFVDTSYGVSCASSNFCVSVGAIFDIGPDTATLSGKMWNGSTWQNIQFAPPPSADAGFEGVTCTTSTFCMAVGWFTTGGHSYPLAEEWNGTTWSVVSTSIPGTIDTEFYAVACSSTTWCMGVGYEQTAGPTVPMAAVFNGSSFTGVSVPTTGLGSDSYLYGVDCIGKWCMAVGETGTGSPYNNLAMEYANGSWKLSPAVPGTNPAELNGVSCPLTTMCMAVGAQNYHGTETNIAERWNGTTWVVDSPPVGNASFGDNLNAVSCVGPTSCVAAGNVNLDSHRDTSNNLIDAWNGSTWVLQNSNPLADNGAFLYGVSCVANQTCHAVGGFANSANQDITATIHRSGYTEVAADGGLFTFGTPFFGSIGGHPLNAPVVGMAMTPDGGGYWEVASDGGLFAFGDAPFFGSMGGKPLNQAIVGIAATADGRGYWEVAADGGLFSFGDAPFYGSMGGKPLNKAIVGMALAPSGLGYYEVATDGGLFAFGLPGQAPFLGSTGNIALNSPIVGMAVTSKGGYYEVARDGGLFAFGGTDKAPFSGSMGGKPLNAPIVGMAVNVTGGYYEVASDGGIFNFGGAPFKGSMGGKPLVEPIVGIAT
jgi:hypothetical protein